MYICMCTAYCTLISFAVIGSMEVTDEQVVPAPPDFSVSPSPSVLLDRVCKALNMETPKPVSDIVCTTSNIKLMAFPVMLHNFLLF